MNNIVKRDSCRLCKSLNLNQVLRLSDAPIGDDYLSKDEVDREQETYPVNLMLCNSCGHLQLSHIIDPEVIYKDYLYISSSSITLEKHFKAYADDIVNRLNLPEKSFVVEMGSNEGILLKFLKDRKMNVLGIDPASHIAKKASEEGIRTIPSFFDSDIADKIRIEHKRAKIFIANNVLANIDNLDLIIKGVKKLLDDEGVFILESGYAVDTIQKTIFDNIHHEHLSYFSIKPLEPFFRKHGMEIFDVAHVSTKGGSIRVYVQFKNGIREKSEKVNEFIENENKIGIYKEKIFIELAKRIDDEKNRLKEILEDLKSNNKSIAGFGAAIGSTQLIYNFELNNYLEFLVDDNPLKQGLFSPGFHIPVYSSEEIYRKNPDAVICLAWRYAKPIMKKHQEYINNGGKFIIPFSNLDYKEDFFE